MIVACEKCNAQFNLDENLLKEGGSKVRCSSCKYIFMVYPPQMELFDDTSSDEYLEETVALDSPPDFSDVEIAQNDEVPAEAFEKAFQDALDEVADREKELLTEDDLTEEESQDPFSEESFEQSLASGNESPGTEPKAETPSYKHLKIPK